MPIRFCCLLAALFMGQAHAASTPLFQRAISINKSTNDFATSLFDLDLVLGDDAFTTANPVTLFDDVAIEPADAGTVYEATSATDPGFDEAVLRITDGLDRFLQFLATEVQSGREQGIGFGESGFFLAAGSPDLAGNIIDAITLRLDGFTFSGGPVPGGGPEFEILMTVTVLGRVPEPHS
ncbi:MAG: hypothetical protein AAGA92_04330, partial [Planctomycetota bacterium]